MSHPIKNSKLTNYNLVWKLARPILGMVLHYRAGKGKEDAARIGERFGNYSEQTQSHQSDTSIKPGAIWLHAVSVGESVAALALIDALSRLLPKQHFLITTNTVTAAQMVARANSKAVIQHLYQPLDHPVFVDRFLDYVQPSAAIFMESDFWPNLIILTKARGVPVVFASSQISAKATARWRGRPAMAATMFGAADLILAVNEQQAGIFAQLRSAKENTQSGDKRPVGGTIDKISICGSLKMAVNTMPVDHAFVARMSKIINRRSVLLAASTHDGEDSVMLDLAEKLGPEWLVIIAPRHPARASEIASLASARGIKMVQRSKSNLPSAEDAVFLMDTLGEMGSLFSLADIVFLAGSLRPIGGHNPLEPASFGKPIISGPHVFKNSAEFAAMRDAGLIFDVDGIALNHDQAADKTASQIATIARSLHDDPAKRQSIEKTSRAYVAKAAKRQDRAAANILAVIAPQKKPAKNTAKNTAKKTAKKPTKKTSQAKQ